MRKKEKEMILLREKKTDVITIQEMIAMTTMMTRRRVMVLGRPIVREALFPAWQRSG
jgi:hypothetical protein